MAAAAPLPWLADLPDEWDVQPISAVAQSQSQSESHPHLHMDFQHTDGASRRGSLTSIASVRQAKDSNMTQSAAGSMRKGLSQRDPNCQSIRTGSSPVRTAGKGTVQSVDSVVHYDTVERQPSPSKKEAEMEWKRRLVDGELGYGDQTDLFGPSGLENIFQSPSKPSSAAKGRPSNLKQPNTIPSSPPPWPPSMLFKQRGNVTFPSLSQGLADQESASHMPTLPVDDLKGEAIESSIDSQTNEDLEFGTNLRTEHSGMTDRKVSGQTEIGNETFSPVFISKHTTLNGEINYTPLDSDTARLLQTSTSATMRPVPEENFETSNQSVDEQSEPADVFEESIPQAEVSLPDNLPTGTPPTTRLGTYVTMHRGGQSNYGSFRTRPLSPSAQDSTNLPTNVDILGSEGIPSVVEHLADTPSQRNSPSHSQPQTPTRGNVSVVPELPTPRSAGSPLKLFGVYDTFTNRKLLRRLSQLEDEGGNAVNKLPKLEIQTDPETLQQTLEKHRFEVSIDLNVRVQSPLDNFGEHEIDEIDFEANLSFPSDNERESEGERGPASRSPSGSPEPDVLPPGAMSPAMFHADHNDEAQLFGVKRKLSDQSSRRSRRPESSPRARNGFDGIFDTRKTQQADGSFKKFPTPKRRRTLHELDFAMENLSIEDDHIPSDGLNLANISNPTTAVLQGAPDLSMPTPDRPRNPTPDQQRPHDEEESDMDFPSSSPKLRAIRDQIEESSLPGSIKLVNQAKAVASEVAAFTLNVTKHDSDAGERKRSITTQDFLDEAMHIMSLIRARGRPTGLDSVTESNEESLVEDDQLPKSDDPSVSMLRISRPPSREGPISGWRSRHNVQNNPSIEIQLKKFQERDDTDILDATVDTLRLRSVEEEEYSEMSDGTNAEIRISGPIEPELEENPLYGNGHEGNSIGSQGSENFSTGKTQGTNSTHKSDNVATLAPESVAHLIPEEVAGMAFDRTLNRWVKRNKLQIPTKSSYASPHPSNTLPSDDDPFNNIPDLTVDEVQEMGRVHSSQVSKGADNVSHDKPETKGGHIRFSSRDDSAFVALNSSHAGSKVLHKSSTTTQGKPLFDSSQPHIETRATSWATDHRLEYPKVASNQPQNATEQHQDLGDPHQQSPHHSFGSEDLQDFSSDPADGITAEDSDIEELPPRQAQQPQGRKVSFQAHTFRKRRFGPAVDQSEVSIIAELPDKRLMSVSVAVSKPPGTLHDEFPVAFHEHPLDRASLILSDLPDFTVAEIDEKQGPTERDLGAVVARHGLEVEGDRYALAVQSLVKSLTDVKGDELFWEDIKQLSLKGQNLQSLHGLGELCARLQQLDVSGNSLSHLEGAPFAIRWLDASGNSLSSLTAWNHFINLQYLDISHNNVTDLEGLSCLVHLRDLKANDNQIRTLDGLRELDSLLKLDVSQNEISCVDFSNYQWTHLEMLDISANRLTQIFSLERLPALQNLAIDDNRLPSLTLGSDDFELKNLHRLTASKNKLQSLDLRRVRQIRHLDLDVNEIRALPGLSLMSRLDLLSLRQQSYGNSSHDIWETVFKTRFHARRINMSGNTFAEPIALETCQNTVSHLELASCGLLSLPKNFGLNLPNLSSLNLNFNALKDIRPLLNVQHLTTLNLAGNRLRRLRQCIETVARLPGLTELDLRDNAFALGFYAARGTDAIETQALVQHQNGGITEARARDRGLAYLLPANIGPADAAHRKTLDDDTLLRRRVHDILLASACSDLRTLDGRELDRKKALERDGAWHRLRELGVLKPRNK